MKRCLKLLLLLAALWQPVAADVPEQFNLLGQRLLETEVGANQGVVSPYSVGSALAMTAFGARGSTAEGFAKVLGFSVATSASELAALQKSLGELAASSKGQFSIANRLWASPKLSARPQFLDKLKNDFQAPCGLADFDQPEKARGQINDWISQQTQKKIEELLPAGSLNPLTRLVLTNAVYIKGNWVSPFPEKLTRPAPFHRHDGSTVEVPTMQNNVEVLLGQVGEVRIVILPFRDERLGMAFLIPKKSKWGPQFFGEQYLDEVLSLTEYRTVELLLPRFKVKGDYSLKNTLKKLGLAVAFSPQSDFSGINDEHDLELTGVFHQVVVEVNEQGAEAAAATGVVAATRGFPQTIKFDRPFGFALVDLETRTVLFMGQVYDPSIE